ncbi:NUDIX domain-containing protein [Patescibacteria group bacterium]|nr:NUDIX domain-containing protein [Patescibacteria group bacterium]
MIAARACIITLDGKLLLIQRSTKSGFGGERWELPGGKLDSVIMIEKSDPGLQIAFDQKMVLQELLREIREETKLQLQNGFFYAQSIHRIPEKDSPYFDFLHIQLYYVFTIGLPHSQVNITLSSEHQARIWIDHHNDLEGKEFMPKHEDIIRAVLKNTTDVFSNN